MSLRPNRSSRRSDGIYSVTIRFERPSIRELDGVQGVSSVSLYRFGKDDEQAWREAARRHGGSGRREWAPHYFVIAQTISGYPPHPVMLRLEHGAGAGASSALHATALPEGSAHAYGDLLDVAVRALGMKQLEWFATL